jgi:hypothetical protein
MSEDPDEALEALRKAMLKRERNRPSQYILDENGRPVHEPDLLKWGQWFEKGERVVAKTWIADEYEVSTVFLGLDYRWDTKGPPIVWETMVFDKERNDIECDRCAGTREQAEAMHAKMVDYINKWIQLRAS